MVIDKTITIDVAMNTGLALIGYGYITFMSFRWLISSLFKQREKRRCKDKRAKALNAFNDAFDIDHMQQGDPARVITRGDVVILVYRNEKNEQEATSEWWTLLRLALLELKEVRAGGLKRDVSERTAGWGRPARSKKYHYFAENEVTSICRRWMYSGEREPDSFESPDDCAVCRRKLNKGNEQEATREQN